MEPNWAIVKPETLGWQPKIDLKVASHKVLPDCQIVATNDLEAINVWLNQFKEIPTTLRAYQKEAERLLLWCVFEQGVTLADLKTMHFEQYFDFLQNPPLSWLSPRSNLRSGRYTVKWRPLVAPLKKASLLFAVRVISGLINYLVAAAYLKTNPIKLIKKYNNLTIDPEEQKYQVWSRMLEVDEWEAVQQVLQNLPEQNEKQQQYKIRTQLLFSLLYLLGLRIHEVANATWGSFRRLNGNWWFFVKGKSGKLGHVPVNDQLLSTIKIYRLFLKKMPLPEEDDLEAVLISAKTKQPLSVRQLFSDVKAVGKLAALKFKNNPTKKQKLESLSPHWLRHLSASHQDLVGISGTMIQENHRHGSFTTTQIYLHAPDELRAKEMQKLQMSIYPKLYAKKAQDHNHTRIKLSLVGGNLSGIDGLKRLIDSIENNVLVDFKWSRVGELLELIKRYEQIKNFKLPLELEYMITNQVAAEKLHYLKSAIVREAEIRLFQCTINIEQLKN